MTGGKCLSEQDVLNYKRGTLSSEEQDCIENHLAKCSSCFRLVVFTLKGGEGVSNIEDKEDDFLL